MNNNNNNYNNNKENNENESKGILQESIDFIFKTITTQQNSTKRSSIINSKENLIDNLASSLNNLNNNSSFGDNENENENDSDNNKYEYIIRASFLEIYNEEIVDLLNLKTPSKHILIRDINNVNSITGLSMIHVNEPDDCYQ